MSPNAIAVEADGSLLVVDGPLGFTGNGTGQRLLMRVHPVTGDRTVLSAPGKGQGPSFLTPVGHFRWMDCTTVCRQSNW